MKTTLLKHNNHIPKKELFNFLNSHRQLYKNGDDPHIFKKRTDKKVDRKIPFFEAKHDHILHSIGPEQNFLYQNMFIYMVARMSSKGRGYEGLVTCFNNNLKTNIIKEINKQKFPLYKNYYIELQSISNGFISSSKFILYF
jgi:hypothetical protein